MLKSFRGGQMRCVLAVPFFALSCWAAPPIAVATRSCYTEKLVRRLAVPRTIERKAIPSRTTELPRAGTILEPDEAFGPLRDDEYLYLILNATGQPGRETIVYSPRVPVDVLQAAEQSKKVPETFLATHRGLLQRVSESQGIPVSEVESQVRGAGGFRMTSGHVTRLTNRSGTFPAGRENLDYSGDVLGRRGFNPAGSTYEKVDLEKDWKDFKGRSVNPFHIEEEEAARMAVESHTDPKRLSIRMGMGHIHHYLTQKFPDGERPGYFDTRQVLQATSAYLKSLPPEKRSEANQAITDLLYYLARANREGFDFAVYDLCRKNPDGCMERFEECENHIAAAGALYYPGQLPREF